MLRNNMAVAHLHLGEYALAQALLEEAIDDEPANAMLWTNLSAARLKHGNLEQALVAVERALELDPDYPVAQQAHSCVLARKGESKRGPFTDLACI
jgi:tetratricopeptide (TPR) repeat protein